MIDKVVKKIPWKTVVQLALDEGIPQLKKLLANIRSRRSAAKEDKSEPVAIRIDAVESRLKELEDEFEEALETIQTTSAELSQNIHDLAEATKVVSARVIIAIALSGVALIISIASLIFGMRH